MSKAEELLDSLSIEDIQPFTSQPDIEGHIVIDKDRIIHVPTELKRIAVQYDANIETVTFDCPRYWDEHDLSEMNIYINYKLPSNLINNIGQSLVKNLRINEDDENIINFDWTIGPILTNNKGDLPFSVCAKSKTNQDSDEAIRWYTEINTELTISEGMDGSGDIEDNYEDLFPDIINDIISKLDGINATYDEKLDAFNANATSKTESFDTNAQTKTTEFNDNAAQKTLDYNNNCTSKTESFNQNSTQKVTEFNDNYTSKLNSFNSNADSRIEELDTHADLALSSIPKNNAEGTDNVFDDGLESPLFALGGDGKSEQVVTQGYNLLPNNLSSQNINGITITKNNDGSITLNGTATKSTSLVIADLTNFSLQGTYNFYLIGKNNKINLQGVEDGEIVAYLPYSYNTNDYITKEYETAKNLTRIFSYIGSGVTVNNETFKYMITQGSDVKNYEPYSNGIPSPSPDYPQPINSIEGSVEFDCNDNKGSSNQVTFDLGEEKLRSVGDVKDELVVDLSTGDYYKVENIGQVTLTGQESNWYYYSPAEGTEVHTYSIAQNFPGINATNINAMSDKFLGASADTIHKTDSQLIAISNTQMIIRINNSLANSVGAFKQWLSTHNTIVDYLLKTPTTKKLGTLSTEDLAKLKTFKGYNNVTVNTNLGLMNIRFTYGLDIKKYVDNKIAQLSEQLIKGE